jgi:NADH-quinone oxidoreductase subunit N
MTICLLSLAGIPPTVGFLGKLYLFQSVVQAGDTPLAVIAVLNSVVAVFYYLRVIVMMYMHESPESDLPPSRSPGVLSAAWLCAALVALLGLFPAWVIDLVRMCL